MSKILLLGNRGTFTELELCRAHTPRASEDLAPVNDLYLILVRMSRISTRPINVGRVDRRGQKNAAFTALVGFTK